MPTRSGASHGFAALSSVVLGSVISEWISAVVPAFSDASVAAGQFLTSLTGTPYDARFAGSLVLATGIAFCWGVAYHFAR